MLYGLIQLFLQPGLGTVSLSKGSPVISVWCEGGAGHIRVSRMGGVGLRDELGYDLLLTVITNLDAEIKFTNSVSLDYRYNTTTISVQIMTHQNQLNLVVLSAQVRVHLYHQ